MSKLIRTAKLLFAAVALFCCSTAMAQGGGKSGSSSDAITLSSSWGLTSGRYVAKTNVLMLGAGVANLGAEVVLTDRYSVDIPVMYSPYSYSDNWSLKGLAIQPEARFWLDKALEGHFVGVHGEVGIFNVATGDSYRYESYNNEPSWGLGLSYGYAMKFSEHFGAEFTIGAGYVDMRYNKYYNTANGALVEKCTEKDYWGITKLGAVLTYAF